jgi:predicted transcriptional regulator of viral defense system
MEKVKVTSLEKTVIDCIDNINLGGGIDEILNILSFIHYLNEDKLIAALRHYDKIILYQKTGYMLEHFNERLKLPDEFFEFCKSKLTNQVKYFLNEEYSNCAYNKKWQLIAPVNLLSRIYEGL